MSTIYVVTKGAYSDYGIVGIYDDKSVAEKLVQSIGNDARVEEHPLNLGSEEIRQGHQLFWAGINYDGIADAFQSNDFSDPPLELHDYAGECSLAGSVWAKDKQHAIKIASERRFQLIARGEWKLTFGIYYVKLSFGGSVIQAYRYESVTVRPRNLDHGIIRGADNTLELNVMACTKSEAIRIADEHRKRLIEYGEWKP